MLTRRSLPCCPPQARIPTDAGLFAIAVQCLFFFVPGTFCEVMPPSGTLAEVSEPGHISPYLPISLHISPYLR